MVDPTWAALIRRIYKEYLKAGCSSPLSVANLLNSEGIPTALGGKWSITEVRDVLTNRKYTGAFVRFKTRTGKYHAIQDGEIVTRGKTDRPEKPEPMIREDNHEAIIDKRTFERVQAKLAKNQKWTAHRNRLSIHLHRIVAVRRLRWADVPASLPRNGTGVTDPRDLHRYVCQTWHTEGLSACHAQRHVRNPVA